MRMPLDRIGKVTQHFGRIS